MFEIHNLSKQYGTEYALQNVTMNIGRGMNFIIGASGSGKTTLLKILCGMEDGFEGNVSYFGKDITTFTQKEKSALYNEVFGFVWQDFHLLNEATVLENILLPTYLQDSQAQTMANQILKQMKLEDMKNQKVRYLSGGQKQRVAIARELMKNPQVIFCDEPTSALDAKSAKMIIECLREISKKRTVIVVTHDTSLIQKGDLVAELDKGELVSAPEKAWEDKKANWKALKAPVLSIKNAFRTTLTSIKNKPGRFAVSILSLMIAGTLLLTTVSGAVEESGQNEFEQLVATYGEGILDIGLVGSFMSASGAEGMDEDKPGGNVNQDLGGLYEKYENDDRVEFIVSMQPFENIMVTLDGRTYAIEKTGNSPVLTKLLSGDIPAGDAYQVVVPLKFVENLGLTPESAIGKTIDFSATIFQWIDNQPFERPVRIQAAICGVADNTVVYDYEGKTYNYSVDDSFFFNASAVTELRKQAGVANKSANFTIRAKTPEDLIALKDELNQSGIVPLGRFELVEDIVRLNQQTTEQSGTASAVIGVLAVLMVIVIFAMTSVLRKREFAIYKVSGYASGHLLEMMAAETILSAVAAIILMLILSPVLDMAVKMMFDASILSVNQLTIGAVLIFVTSVISFVAEIPAIMTSSVSVMLKAGDKS